MCFVQIVIKAREIISSEFFDKILGRVLLDVLFCVFRFSKAFF